MLQQGQRHCKSVKIVIIVTGIFSTNTNPFKCGSHTVTTFSQPLRISGTRFLLRVVVCNIPSFQIFEKSEKFKTFSNYIYFALKRNSMHCMHHLLVLLHLIVQNLEYKFLIKNLFDKKLYVRVCILPNKIFCCLPSLT